MRGVDIEVRVAAASLLAACRRNLRVPVGIGRVDVGVHYIERRCEGFKMRSCGTWEERVLVSGSLAYDDSNVYICRRPEAPSRKSGHSLGMQPGRSQAEK